MQKHMLILSEFNWLEEKIFKLSNLLLDLSRQREMLKSLGPQRMADFLEFDGLVKELTFEWNQTLRKLQHCLESINWHGNPMPSPSYTSLWSLWWREVRAETLRQHKMTEKAH